MKTLMIIFVAFLLSGSQIEKHYLIITSRIQFSKEVVQKRINVEKCHPSDLETDVKDKNLAQVLQELNANDFEIESHSTAYASTWVVDRVILSR